LAINAGLLSPDQGRRAMRWIASHYGFQPNPNVQLLACSDWWPIRWSVQWVPTGDTCLAALAGMKCGDADLWWPFLRTVVLSAFQSEFPGINMGISSAGAGGGDREDVDSDDPHVHVVVRGLFGIEPAIHEGRVDICPAFPSSWHSASIRTPDIRYEYRRDGNMATFRITTDRPLVKRVRANLTGPVVVTPRERQSVVTVRVGPPLPKPDPPAAPTILVEREDPAARPRAEAEGGQATPPPLAPEERLRLVLFDLTSAANQTVEEMVATRYVFDYADSPIPLTSWWGNPGLTMPPSPRVVESPSGVPFLTTGRPRPGLEPPPKNLLALSSWRPYPLPGGAVIPVGLRCQRLWVLLQSYVHPMKNYIPNGEIVLRYADGTEQVEALIPPFNLDGYFQHFSLRGEAVPMGSLDLLVTGWTPIHRGMARPHADALSIDCNPAGVLREIEVRATCSEGVLGLAGLTLLAAPGGGEPTVDTPPERKGLTPPASW
ncbi:MAG: hypothetical protein QHJ73_08315, partial [Armatimonadota bacterium]|nr:hypothetical protein [Armatimonadota bacterium]